MIKKYYKCNIALKNQNVHVTYVHVSYALAFFIFALLQWYETDLKDVPVLRHFLRIIQ